MGYGSVGVYERSNSGEAPSLKAAEDLSFATWSHDLGTLRGRVSLYFRMLEADIVPPFTDDLYLIMPLQSVFLPRVVLKLMPSRRSEAHIRRVGGLGAGPNRMNDESMSDVMSNIMSDERNVRDVRREKRGTNTYTNDLPSCILYLR